MNDEPECGPAPDEGLISERVTLADGRYLIYYTTGKEMSADEVPETPGSGGE